MNEHNLVGKKVTLCSNSKYLCKGLKNPYSTDDVGIIEEVSEGVCGILVNWGNFTNGYSYEDLQFVGDDTKENKTFDIKNTKLTDLVDVSIAGENFSVTVKELIKVYFLLSRSNGKPLIGEGFYDVLKRLLNLEDLRDVLVCVDFPSIDYYSYEEEVEESVMKISTSHQNFLKEQELKEKIANLEKSLGEAIEDLQDLQRN